MQRKAHGTEAPVAAPTNEGRQPVLPTLAAAPAVVARRAQQSRQEEAREQESRKNDWRRHLTPRPEEAGPGAAPARVAGTRAQLAAAVISANGGEPEHRHFPRAEFITRFELWMDDANGERCFSASLQSVNVSVSGAFLESSFFLPLGTRLHVRFALEEGAEPVQARAEIMREERQGGPDGRTGFGIRFEEFSGQTEVALARLFVGMKLRAFAEEYLQSRRARSLGSELERVVDVLAAWELLKATTPGDPWRGE